MALLAEQLVQRLPSIAIFGLCLGLALAARAEGVVVEPYLQRATPTRIEVHWESVAPGPSFVEWGTTAQLGKRATGHARASGRGARLFGAALTGLTPSTRYFYRVRTGDVVGRIADFRTPPRPEAEAGVRMIVMSDMQRDRARPHVFRDLVAQGVMPLLGDAARARGEAPVAVLMAGDLVRHGERYPTWARELFAPLSPLSRHVPLYPVAGNHDEDSPHYFRYFALPDNGSPRHPERWWWADFSNVRVIGLDSNRAYRVPEQLAWLEQTLGTTCGEAHVDFVFAVLHHPELSELWPEGELPYTGLITRALERFASACGKPAVVFSGHTHAYARGHSRDAPVTLVHVASAGGNLDREGEYDGRDYDEYVTRQDEYGFVVVDVRAGEQASFHIQRIGRGTPEQPSGNVLRDALSIRRDNRPPSRPTLVWPRDEQVSPRELYLTSTPFADPDGDPHGATHWQVTDASCDFARATIDVWRQHGSDRVRQTPSAAMVGPNFLHLTDLPTRTDYCYRVRMRDRGLAWSAWSEPARFRTLPAPLDGAARETSQRAL